ncbi:MAG: RNA polymerase sigma factor [Solirubrobacterales bacterium]
MPIRRKTQEQLAALDDDGLMAYVVEARSEGETEEYESALGVLVFRWERTFLNRASRKIGEYCRRSGYLSTANEAEEIVLETFKDVFRGVDRFEGEAAGQFHKWVQTILDRRVADWFRSRNGEPKVDSYDGARNSDGEVVGMYEIVGDGEIDVEMTVELRILWDDALAAESERDATVVVLKARGYSAADVAVIIEEEGLDDGEGMSTDNVDTIYSRFRIKNRELFLEEAELEVGEPGDRGGEDGDGQS